MINCSRVIRYKDRIAKAANYVSSTPVMNQMKNIGHKVDRAQR